LGDDLANFIEGLDFNSNPSSYSFTSQ